ncbi:LIM domain only protein 7 isoform X4 [Nelusetta ayraudi]|uniref:LIM domain only protein 7 isoform X4 n=1 Tax=Nelusetta ayraudi TaxID=303726 RepID=UPI003F718E06
MEWREQSAVSCDEAYLEARRWIEAVTEKEFGTQDFRSALENGILLCDLINKIKPGIVKRVNRLPTPIAGLDNLNVFLKACGRLGLKEAQLFHPGDLQDLSTRVTVQHQETNRRLKNVLITIYWLGRQAQCDRLYDGPYLNFKAFEGLLGTALYKALHETSSPKAGRDSGFGDSWYSEREEPNHQTEEGGCGHKRDDSLDSLDSLGSQPLSTSSDVTLKGSGDGCCSDTDADSASRMANHGDGAAYRRSVSITPKGTAPFNQFLPTKDKQQLAYVPAPLRKKRAERNEDSRRSWANASQQEDEGMLTSEAAPSPERDGDTQLSQSPLPEARQLWDYDSESGSDSDADRPDPDLVLDDLASRRFHSPTPTTPTNFAVPHSPLALGGLSRARCGSWSKVNMVASVPSPQSVTVLRQRQAPESIDGSKSTNDIQVEIKARRQQTYEELQRHRDSMKEVDDKWQDDLSKWKSRRRSVNSDIVKKKEEREKIEQITYSDGRRSRTFKEMQEKRESKGRLSSLSYLDTEDDAFEAPAVSLRTRALPERSYTIDTPYTSSETKKTIIPESRDAADDPTSTAGRSPALRSRSPVSERTARVRTEESTTVITSSSTTSSSSSSPARKPVEARYPLSRKQAVEEVQPQPSSMEAKPPATSRVSASLPRSFQKAEGSRLSSVVTPRPFGVTTQLSHVASIPRASTLDDTGRGINGKADVSKRSTVPSRYKQFVTSEDESQSSSSQSSSDEEEKAEKKADTSVRSITTTQTVSSVKSTTSQENHCEMRISLNQKPNSSKDFGFEAAWDSTGARVTSVQKGSQAEMCQLHVGDEVLTVNRHQVAEMSYLDWKSCMEEALQEGSLVMDVRQHGQNNWDRDQPSLPFKSHKTINLTSTDHPILLGSPDANSVSSSLDFTSRSIKEALPTPTHQLIDVAANGVNGGGRKEPPTMRNQGGSDAVMPDITVPPISASSNRWSWDPEEERKRQEKWQKQQQRVLEEKYKRDQEKLQEEWMNAQKDISKSPNQQESWRLEVNSHSASPSSPLSPLSQPSSPLWELEERKRREEQERQRQAEERRKLEEEERELQRLQEERRRRERQEEEERRKREEEERELQRLQEDRRRRERQVEEERKTKQEEERKRKQAEELRWQRRREEERAAEERRQQEEAARLRREEERSLEQQQWGDGYHRFTSVSSLSSVDRAKSKSSPHLDEEERSHWQGAYARSRSLSRRLLQEQVRSTRDYWPRNAMAGAELERERRNIISAMRSREPERGSSGDKKGQQPASQAEAERQQILNEMKKKTPLLTDSSWIRQRPATTTREVEIPPMRRGDSLDGLDSSWRSSWAPRTNNSYTHNPRPNSALSGHSTAYGGAARAPRPQSTTLPSSYSMSSLGGGSGTPSSNWSQQSRSSSASSPSPTNSPEPPHQRNRSVSGKKICTYCGTPLGKGAAMIIESLGLCYHLSCFKCFDCKSDLGGSEAGAEVRIRSRQLFCNICYMQFKTGQPTTM